MNVEDFMDKNGHYEHELEDVITGIDGVSRKHRGQQWFEYERVKWNKCSM